MDKINLLINNMLGSSEASVGNLIAEGNRVKILDVFWEYMSLRFWISGLALFSLFMLMDMFIKIWIGEEFVLSKSILILIIINYGIPMIQNSLGQFIYGFGLFNDVWATVTSAILYVILACVLGPILGLKGVLISSSISLVFLYVLWKPYFLYKFGFKIHFVKYWIHWSLLLSIILFSCSSSYIICHWTMDFLTINDIMLNLIVFAVISVVIYSFISILSMAIVSKSFRQLISRFIELRK